MAVLPVTPRPDRLLLAAVSLSVFLLTGLCQPPAARASVTDIVQDTGESRTAGPMNVRPARGMADAETDAPEPGNGDEDSDEGEDGAPEEPIADSATAVSDIDDHAAAAEALAADKKAVDKKAAVKSKNPGPVATHDAPHAAPDTQASSPGTLHQNFSQIEPIGTLTEGPDGGLGEDVWIGSSREKITALIPQAPRVTRFPVIQDLLRRLYLTEAKPDYLSGSRKPEPGQDLLTLRVQKLESMGLYSDATKLYSQITDVPYHEYLARAGVLSMMEGGKGSLGCLETRTVMDRFGELEFWQTLNAVCDMSLARMRPGSAGEGRPEANDIDLSGSNSKVIERLAGGKNFAYRVSTQKDIEVLSPLERAALQDNNAFVFERFHFDGSPVSPAAFGVLLGSKNLDGDMKFTVLARAASYGLRPVSDIQEQYDLAKNDANKKSIGWITLTKLYAKASTADPGMGQVTPTIEALRLSGTYGGPYAAAPFAGVLAGANPAAFPADQVQDIVRIMIIGGQTIPKGWMNRLAEQVSNRNTLLLFIAAELNSDLSTESKYKQPSLKTLFASLTEREKTMIAAVYEKLDKSNRLHNYVGQDVYENLIGLTRSVDYGMPTGDLTSDLVQTYKDKKLGESILLSAIALQGMQLGSLSPGLLQEVVAGMRTVGLTKEARALASEAILSLSN